MPEALAGVSSAAFAARAEAPPVDSGGKRIGILIVAYNAVGTLTQVLKRIPPPVWSNVEEVLVIDDASPDSTYEVAVGYKALLGIEKLTVLRNPRNLGYGGNQKAGYTYFLERGFDVVVLLHGDGQYAPEVLAHLYAPIVSGEADAVFGSRMLRDYGGPLRGGMPFYKFLGNRILSTFANHALGMRLSEFHSGYRAYSLAALRHLDLSRTTDDFHFDTQIIIKLNHQGFRIREVAIPTYYGDEICHVNGLKYARNVVRAILRYKRTAASLARSPEYEEYFVRYPLKQSRGSSHFHFLQLAGRGNEVLDVGCGEGFFALKLKALGNHVTGLDRVRAGAGSDAAFDRFICADVDAGLAEARAELEGRQFDRVLLLDVLEHLRSPERLLRDCLPLVRPQGRLLVSLPNVANVTVRLALLFGRFEYAERGLLDRTHLRFYTRRSGRRLLEQAGYEVLEERLAVMPLELALHLRPESLPARVLNRLLAGLTWLMPSLFGYQMILVARPAGRQAG